MKKALIIANLYRLEADDVSKNEKLTIAQSHMVTLKSRKSDN